MEAQLDSASIAPEFCGGLGLRPSHYPYLESHQPRLAKWFEVISENYMDSQGQPLEKLLKFRRDYPIACHGVSMGLGGPDPVDMNYLSRLKKLIDKVDPWIVSDHLCWTSVNGHYSHDLLPLPYNDTVLKTVCNNIQMAQDFLQRPLLIENPSSYIQFKDNTLTEWEFLKQIHLKTGARFLLDINNVYVTCVNFSWDPIKYLNNLPTDAIGQIHLAGFTDKGKFLFDTHSAPVDPGVWDLYQKQALRLSGIPLMIEWDDELPEFSVLEDELFKAEAIFKKALASTAKVSDDTRHVSPNL